MTTDTKTTRHRTRAEIEAERAERQLKAARERAREANAALRRQRERDEREAAKEARAREVKEDVALCDALRAGSVPLADGTSANAYDYVVREILPLVAEGGGPSEPPSAPSR